MPVYGILFDQSKCIGCKACEQACQSEHGQRPHVATALDSESFNFVQDVGGGKSMRHFCRHCQEPTCVSVCPVAALQKTKEGPVIWVGSRCLGCRYCMMACPFAIPKYEWRSANPRIRKCDMCVHRVSKGMETACASICPTGATVFGKREDMLAEAHRRLKESPKVYEASVFGEVEVGGTSVLMLLTQSAKANHLPDRVATSPLPVLTWTVLEKLPQIIPLWAVFLGGMYWLTERKNDVARESRADVHAGDANEHE